MKTILPKKDLEKKIIVSDNLKSSEEHNKFAYKLGKEFFLLLSSSEFSTKEVKNLWV